MSFSLGEPDFVSTSALRNYCENGRTLIRPLAPELHMASIELKAALKEIPLANGSARWKARTVAAHLDRAAQGIEWSVAEMIRTYLSFERNFIHSDPARSKKHFDLNH